MIIVLFNAFKSLHISFKKSNIYKLLVIGIFSLSILSYGFYFYESQINSDLTIVDSLWWGFVTSTTVGYGDFYPVTLGGRVIAAFLMLIGISAFGFITASIASVFVENRLKEGMGLMDIKFNDHIVIIGWNYKSDIILKELIKENPDTKIVIIDEIERLDLNYKNVYFVHGDSTKDEVLIKANISSAKTAIVVSDKKISVDGMSDAKSVLICLAIDKLNPDIHLISEVLDDENIVHFQRANVNDIIISNQMSGRVMVRSALYKNVSSALKELLTSTYGNELYESFVKPKDIGLLFKDLSSKYLEKHNAIVLGIANKLILLNPDKNYVVSEDDIIIYICKDKL